MFAKLVAGRLRSDPGYLVIQLIPGVGPILAAVFVAEIGDINRFSQARAAGLVGRADPETPRVRHHRAPRADHQTGLPAGALGRGRGRATGPAHTRLGQVRDQVGARRGRNIGVVAAARELTELVFYGLRDGHIRRLSHVNTRAGGVNRTPDRGGRGSCSHDPRTTAWSPPLIDLAHRELSQHSMPQAKE